jgi:hypothetical protein
MKARRIVEKRERERRQTPAHSALGEQERKRRKK